MKRQITEDKVEKYLRTYNGAELLRCHTLIEVGTWVIWGESTNPGYATGPQIQPYLGYYKGRLRNAIRFAVDNEQFWLWGGGGTIRKATRSLANEIANRYLSPLSSKNLASLPNPVSKTKSVVTTGACDIDIEVVLPAKKPNELTKAEKENILKQINKLENKIALLRNILRGGKE